jgi:MSHA biogenesis protein MshO
MFKTHGNNPLKTQGFTLVELVTVIIVLGVVSVGLSGIVRTGMGIYTDVTERDQLLSDSRFVVERLNRELRMALPNSVRVRGSASTQCIEFVPLEWVTFYTQLPILPDTSSPVIVNVVEIVDSHAQFSLQSGDFAVVYPTTNADVYDLSNNKRKKIDACTDTGDGDCNTADAAGNHLAQLQVAAAFASNSPASRLNIVRQAISYCARSGSIYRHINIDSNGDNIISTIQPLYTSGGILMAESLVNDLTIASDLPFRIADATLRRNALVQILLAFEHNDEIVTYSNGVHIPNVP